MWAPIAWVMATGPRQAVASFCVVLTTASGAIVAVPPAAATLEPIWYASRSYVRDYVKEEGAKIKEESAKYILAGESTKATVTDTQIEVSETRSSWIDDRILGWELQLAKETDESNRQRIQWQLRQLQGERDRLNRRLEELRRIRGG